MEKENRRAKPMREFSSAFEPQDAEERELDEMFRDGTFDKAIKQYQKKGVVRVGRKASAQPTKVPVTMRLDRLTLLVLQDQARTEGLRYQSLINSVLLKYITGQLVERKK